MKIRKYMDLYSKDCDLKYQSASTRKTYKYCVAKFLDQFKNEVEPKAIPTQKIKEWLLTFETLNTRKQMLCSVKSFYELTIKMPNKIKSIPYPKKEKKLPKVINAELLAEKIKQVPNVKHKAILTLGLSCGLRVSEVVNLKWSDLDRERQIIHIKNAKGRKDRCVPLNTGLILLLEKYWYAYKTKEYVFGGQSSPKYSANSIQKIVKKYIAKNASFHLLRHSYATYAVDNGTELKPLSVSLGHKSTKTTEIYYHASTRTLQTIKQAI